MANTMTALAPTLFSAARIVPRELTGYLGAISQDFDDKGVAKGDTVKVDVAPVQTTAAVTPSQTFTAGTDRVSSSYSLTLNQFLETSWNLTPEQERSLVNANGIAQDYFMQTIQQGIRALVNGMESYVGGVIQAGASRGYGTAGTAPFGSTVADAAQVRKILVDNGAPMTDLSLVIDTTAGINLRSLSNLFKVNEAGAEDLLRQGVIGRLFGMDVRESAGVKTNVKGTGASYTSSAAGFAVGTTSIPIITGTGTVLAGDVVTFAGDTNKYIVQTGVAAPGTIVIQEPGLKVALAASAVAMTIGNNYTANTALHKNAAVIVARPGLQPDGGAFEQMVITDDQTGLSFLLLRVPGNALTSWYLRVIYDAFCPNPYAIGTLLG